MALTTVFYALPSQSGAQPLHVPVRLCSGGISDAIAIGVAKATKNPRFNTWCVCMKVETDEGEVVAEWRRSNA